MAHSSQSKNPTLCSLAALGRIYRTSDGQVIVKQCRWAISYWSRLRGLIGVKHFTVGEEGLWFSGCHEIHMWFMSMPIDVLFLNKISEYEFKISSLREGLQPWRLLPATDRRASDTLELPSGTVRTYQLKPGDLLCTNSG